MNLENGGRENEFVNLESGGRENEFVNLERAFGFGFWSPQRASESLELLPTASQRFSDGNSDFPRD